MLSCKEKYFDWAGGFQTWYLSQIKQTQYQRLSSNQNKCHYYPTKGGLSPMKQDLIKHSFFRSHLLEAFASGIHFLIPNSLDFWG